MFLPAHALPSLAHAKDDACIMAQAVTAPPLPYLYYRPASFPGGTVWLLFHAAGPVAAQKHRFLPEVATIRSVPDS
jgi:hypothetical protein